MQKINNIQGLRAIAANMIVILHLIFFEQKYGNGHIILPSWFNHLSIGVDIFFLISGFIMAIIIASGQGWKEFMEARLIRIYPIYWIYATLTLIALYVVKSPLLEITSIRNIIDSYALIPSSKPPFMAVAWSLVYEMSFYAVLIAAIFLRINLKLLITCWAVLICLFGTQETTNPLLNIRAIGFIVGMLIGICYKNFVINIKDITPMWIAKIGDASYSIYLSHILVLSVVGVAFSKLQTIGIIPHIVFVVGSIIIVNIFGVLSYQFLEKPMLKKLRG